VPAKLTSSIRTRARTWVLRRQGTDVLPLTLGSRRIYILPTRPGWIFALLILVTFIAGMNYGNGLALLFAFWMAGFALVAMVQTQRNLAATRILSGSAEPAFAGESVVVTIAMSTRAVAGDLALSIDGDAAASAEIAPDGRICVQISAHHRGRWRSPPLRLSSTAPFGLFKTWTWLSPDLSTLVYPRPAGILPMPDSPGDEGGNGRQSGDQDELAWLRDFRTGDSPRQVAWKAFARGAPLLVREYRGSALAARDFDFTTMQDPDIESRLSQLARWCTDAASCAEAWTLRLPGERPLAGQGKEHLEQCLRNLALYGLPDVA
jgi:uncharacterized protein (DUF58 family)